MKGFSITLLVLIASTCHLGCSAAKPAPTTKTETVTPKETPVAREDLSQRFATSPDLLDTSREIITLLDAGAAQSIEPVKKEVLDEMSKALNLLPVEIDQLTRTQLVTLGSDGGFMSEVIAKGKQEKEKETPKLSVGLDANYLAESVLLSEAVRSFDLPGESTETKLESISNWVDRQCYLELSLPIPVPPLYALLRGSGSPLERSYILLRVIKQMGLQGYLIGSDAEFTSISFNQHMMSKEKIWGMRFWAVAVKDQDRLLLINPFTGKLYREEKTSKAITFETASSDPGEILKTLAAIPSAGKFTESEIRNSIAFSSEPLPSLTPRMKWVESQLAKEIRIHLATDWLEIKKQLNEGVKLASGKTLTVKFWNQPQDGYTPFRCWSGLLPVDQGGLDKPSAEKRLNLVDYAEQLIYSPLFPRLPLSDSGEAKGFLKRNLFLSPIARTRFFGSNSPRERILRGQLNDVVPLLTQMKDASDLDLSRYARRSNTNEQIIQACDKAERLFANLTRALRSKDPTSLNQAGMQIDEFMKDAEAQPLVGAIITSTSQILNAEASYLLAIRSTEIAIRAELRAKTISDAKLKASLKTNWEIAADWWQRFISNYPDQARLFPDRIEHAKNLRQLAERFIKMR
jgi:hypothetical protein